MEPAARFELVIVGGAHHGTTIAVEGGVTIGSSPQNSVQLEDPRVKPAHAQIVVSADQRLWIADLTGAQLTYVNGFPITQASLEVGATIGIGELTFLVQRVSSPVPKATEPRAKAEAKVVPRQIIAGRYEILELIAAGGMGEVYKARHVELGKTIAVKVMKPELTEDPEFVERFKREAVAASRIGQHNIVDISDFGSTGDGRFYFVMEYLDGELLSAVIAREHGVSVERAGAICLQIARALWAAHQQGIIHRDLKPENVILLQRDGAPDFVKVLDFGVAKVGEVRGAGGRMVGTPQYMSPEQAAAMALDARSDVYALGLIFQELITGKVVFDAESPALTMAAQLTEPAPPLTSPSGAPIDPRLGALVAQMLEKRPEARPQSMGEVIQMLEQVLGLPSRATPQRGLAPTQPRPFLITPTHAVEVSATGGAPMIVPLELLDPVQRAPALHPPRRQARGPLLLALALGALGVAAAVFAKYHGSEVKVAAVPVVEPAPVVAAAPVAPEPPAPLPPAPITRVRLAISSTPPGATVFSDETSLGKTPLELQWEKGKALPLKLEAEGYVPDTRTLAPEADLEVGVVLQAVPKPVMRAPVAPIRQALPMEPPVAPVSEPPPPPDDGLKDAPY